MRTSHRIASFLLFAVLVPLSYGQIKHRFICIDNFAKKNQLIHIDQFEPDNNWVQPLPGTPARDIQLLDRNRVLISVPSGCREYELSTGKKLWEVTGYKRIYTARRLPDGTTLLGENTKEGIALYVVNREGRELSRRILISNAGDLRVLRIADNGNYLLSLTKPRRAVEMTPAGEIVWEVDLGQFGGKGYKVLKSANGNYLASTGDAVKVIEVDGTGKLVRYWGEQKKGDHAAWRLDFFSGFDLLPGDHVVAANWLGHGKHGTGPHLVEFDENSKLVWQWEDHALAKQITNVLILDHRVSDD
ncbi:MAG: hypothetical protein HN742_21505 [Lentisphaerae bacterium]|jgi:hypothetical protein|nr:hypothetical protein [Lentisphaerota bacterium]MBT4817326.1 hypothetical protein [Lentisphaerota bacterium]MBT5613089.1 hypothetical protein [Lentisphaerota bacterium]MBT7056439.1 hypothetical protein [Lentisphaerota bacterium]MBT7844468.1 hypothetical protein [Lentisphaerota bacterium]